MSLAAIPASVSQVSAQAAFVETDSGAVGQGFVFRENGACWLVTAGHLFRREGETDRQGDFRLLLEGQPAIEGEGLAYLPFWDGLDLAVGAVRFPLNAGCRADVGLLDAEWRNLSGLDALRLPYVDRAGRLDWTGARLSSIIDHARFAITPVDAFRGRSGSFAFRDDRPVGMVVDQRGDDHGLIRVEEIAMNLRRWLEFSGGPATIDALPVAASQEAGFDVVVESTTMDALEIGMSADNVLGGEAPFLYSGRGTITLRVASGDVEQISRVVIESAPGPGEAVPKNVRIGFDLSEDGSGFPRHAWGGTFDPAGRYDTGTKRPERMRRVVLTFWDAWSAGPVRIDRIRLY